jgi:cytochrome c peroxidase
MTRSAGKMAALCTATLVFLALRVPADFEWDIPAPFPAPPVPVDNPMSAAKVELGRHLFYDRRLSVNGRQSCASCHRQEMAFTDGRARAVGTTGERHPRSSMSLANVAYAPALTWADSALSSLEHQALGPALGTTPVELGLTGQVDRVVHSLRSDATYRRLMPLAFPGDTNPWTLTHVFKGIAAFERTLISVRSPYDRYRYSGEQNAISESAKRGERFFFSGQRGRCFQCHGGWNFSGALRVASDTTARPAFFNTGLYNVVGQVSYPSPNTGLHQHTQRLEDVGRFRAPTLRNIAVTAPYMHDGSIATLSEVLDHYAAGGRSISSGAHRGDGRTNQNKASNVRGFAMTSRDKADLLAFLETLTDTVFLNDSRLSDPWRRR